MHLRDLRIGMRVIVQGNKHGVCRFLGRTKFARDDWVGVELDTINGKHDGVVEGVRYFQCLRAKTGIFVRPQDVELEDQEQIGLIQQPHSNAGSRTTSPYPGSRAATKSPFRTSTQGQIQRTPSMDSNTSTSSELETHRAMGNTSPTANRATSPPRRSHHSRESSDVARLELENLLKKSSYLRDKPQVMQNLTKLIARRPSTVEMMRSGILNTGRGASLPPSIPESSSSPSGKIRSGWSMASPEDDDLDPSARRMFVFGENAHGELNTGDENDCFSPTEIFLPPVKGAKTQNTSPSDFAQVCLGLNHMVVLTLSNEVLTCGSWVANLLGTDDRQNLKHLKRLKQFEDLRKENPANPIISISCGDRHTVALHNDGSCESFGGTLYGKLGHRSSGASANDALPQSSSYLEIPGLKGQKVTQMSAGNWHTLCCTTSGTVFSFGGGGKFFNQGQLGHGDYEDIMTPKQIAVFGHLPALKVFVKSIVCGGYHSLVLTVDRLVYSFGSGQFGQLGLGTVHNHSIPQLITSLLVRGSGAGRTIGLAAGENHSMCVQADGAVYSWGYGQQGQLGHGISQNEKLPKKISYFSKRNIIIVQVDAGWRHSIALGENHSVYTWGHGDHGQLGHGDTRSCATPQLVESLEGLEIKTVGAGGSHSLAYNDFFKAAQELVFLQRVREFKQVKQNQSKIPLRKSGTSLEGSLVSPRGGGVVGAGAIVSPQAHTSAAMFKTPHTHADGSVTIPSPNPLIPLHLKSMLHNMTDDDQTKGSGQRPPSKQDRQTSMGSFDTGAINGARSNRPRHSSDTALAGSDEYDDGSDLTQSVEQLNEAFPPLAASPGVLSQDEEFEEEAAPSARKQIPKKMTKADDEDEQKYATNEENQDEDEYDENSATGPTKQRKPRIYEPSSSGSSITLTPRTPRPLTSSKPLCIELVYSRQVTFTHRFITFQTITDEIKVRAMIDDYKRGPNGPRDVLLEQLMVNPANTVARTQRAGHPLFSPNSTARYNHIYEYDSHGPNRYTLLFIISTVATDEDLWPAWASSFFQLLTVTAPDTITNAAGQLSYRVQTTEEALDADNRRPCFRELRPPPKIQPHF